MAGPSPDPRSVTAHLFKRLRGRILLIVGILRTGNKRPQGAGIKTGAAIMSDEKVYSEEEILEKLNKLPGWELRDLSLIHI